MPARSPTVARAEIEYYRQGYPEFQATVAVRDDMYWGMLVSGGKLLIGRQTKIPASRVEALLQHEIGTHLVTYYNGRARRSDNFLPVWLVTIVSRKAWPCSPNTLSGG